MQRPPYGPPKPSWWDSTKIISAGILIIISMFAYWLRGLDTSIVKLTDSLAETREQLAEMTGLLDTVLSRIGP